MFKTAPNICAFVDCKTCFAFFACSVNVFPLETIKITPSQYLAKIVDTIDIEFDFDYGDSLNIKMYVDVTVAEIFLCDGKVSVSRCFEQIKVGEPVLVKTDGKITKAKAYKF